MFSDSITASIDHRQPFLRMSRDALLLARYATDEVFCHILSFEVVSAPISHSFTFCPFPWIELSNEV